MEYYTREDISQENNQKTINSVVSLTERDLKDILSNSPTTYDECWARMFLAALEGSFKQDTEKVHFYLSGMPDIPLFSNYKSTCLLLELLKKYEGNLKKVSFEELQALMGTLSYRSFLVILPIFTYSININLLLYLSVLNGHTDTAALLMSIRESNLAPTIQSIYITKVFLRPPNKHIIKRLGTIIDEGSFESFLQNLRVIDVAILLNQEPMFKILVVIDKLGLSIITPSHHSNEILYDVRIQAHRALLQYAARYASTGLIELLNHCEAFIESLYYNNNITLNEEEKSVLDKCQRIIRERNL